MAKLALRVTARVHTGWASVIEQSSGSGWDLCVGFPGMGHAHIWRPTNDVEAAPSFMLAAHTILVCPEFEWTEKWQWLG